MTRPALRFLPVTITLGLAACASTPPSPPTAPASAPQVVRPASPKPSVDTIPQRVGAPAAPQDASNVWDRLRGSFQMADCDADPSIMGWARKYTQNPSAFEAQMREVMPRLMYVQQLAAKHGVAGEFALLPWVESHYRPVPGGKGNPAGMWQIMPVTANALGMRVDKNFDGRLDMPAATDAIMALLRRYHDDLGDWRMADYAFNAGEFAVRKLIDRYGVPGDEPAIPKMPVKRVTREHLAKLLAISCVVREPGRFNVQLPLISPEQQLVSVPVEQSMPLAQAANHAGMSVDELKNLNAGFRNGYVDKQAASYLVMPSGRVEQFRNSLLQNGGSVADAGDGSRLAAIPSSPSAQPDDSATAPGKTHDAARTHTVKPGETLWNIARRYSLNVDQIKRWNGLQSSTLRMGQVLKLDAQG
jgi:membrane-bound lytic murein transglycosylase D